MKKMASVITTTLRPDLIDWLAAQSLKHHRTRRAILEEALEHYQTQKIRERLSESFARAKQSPQILTMAEDGLDDALEQLARYEK